jgi:cytochrome c556
MMKKRTLKQTLGILIMSSGVLVAANINAHSGATGVVKQRMDVMSDMADAMKAMASVVKGKQEFNREIFIQGGELIAGHSNMLPELFPEGSIQGSSEALPAIWQQWDDFVSLNDGAKANAEKMVKMAQEGSELRPLTKQFIKLGGSCKACHKDYRKKK